MESRLIYESSKSFTNIKWPRIFSIIILTLTLQNCATFPKSSLNKQLLSETHLTKLNAQYKVRAEKDSLFDNKYIDFHNAFEKFYRGKGRGCKDTMKIDDLNRFSFKIKLIENHQIEIGYLKDGTVFRIFNIEYKLKKDGCIYLKNNNFKIIGIPYLFGGIDIKKLRLTTVDNFLIIEEVYHSSGATLLIFGDSKIWSYINKYERIE